MKLTCDKCTKQITKNTHTGVYSGYLCASGRWDARGLTKQELDEDVVSMDCDPWVFCDSFKPINYGK